MQSAQAETVQMIKTLLPVVEGPSVPPDALYKQACSNDEVTTASWGAQWLKQAQDNAAKYDFNANSAMQVYAKEAYKPIVIAGSGPSLKRNAERLKDRGDIRIVSCLHNFSYFEDMGIMTENDYYLNLDAGDITVSEVFEFGTKTEAEYWEMTKNRTLLAYVSSSPTLLRNWKGKILFFFSPQPTKEAEAELYKLFDPKKVPCFQVGGNALGACLYAAKAILGGSTIIFVGADFCFSYDHHFHPKDSKYDAMFRGVTRSLDIWGNSVFSWQSYLNFKNWFEYIACGGMGGNPQMFINASEGGTLGVNEHQKGVMKQFIYMDLRSALYAFTMFKKMPELMDIADKQQQLLF